MTSQGTKTFQFSIIASGLDPQADDFEARFYDAGCDDATISFQKGHIIIDFAREAETLDAAIASAVANVEAAGATVNRVEPDPLVSLSEIAGRTGMTRAAMSLYASGQRAEGFPAPVVKVTSDSPLWDWAEVAIWLYQRKKIAKGDAIGALIVREANEAIYRHEPQLARRLREKAKEYDMAY